MLATLLAITCYVSPNPTPYEWQVSGSRASVDAFVAVLSEVPEAKLVDRAAGAALDFALVEFPPTLRYRDYIRLLQSATEVNLQPPSLRQKVRSCKDGRAEDVDDPYAAPVILGIVGAPGALDKLGAATSWTTTSPVLLADGRAAVTFRPTEDQIPS
jgi:hypothetical protein